MGDIKGMEPVAWRYRWKLDGEWVNWRISSAGQRHPRLNSLEEVALYTADQVKELADRLEKAEAAIHAARDAHLSIVGELTAALAEARKVMKETRSIVCDGAESGFNSHDGAWAERLYVNNGALTRWLEANKVEGG